MRSFENVDAFRAAVGEHISDSSWTVVDQARIDMFAEATGDHQWIHVDPVRAASGPFGRTIAHGFLTLSLIPVMLEEVLEVKQVAAFLNYGTQKVRFPRPVPVDSRVRASVTLKEVDDAGIGVRATMTVEIRLDDDGKPACIADIIVLLVSE